MDAYIATTFFRHQRLLRALMIEGQAWFCLNDLGRLLALPYPERRVRRLDSDQRRESWIKADGQWGKHLLVSESGAITLIVHSQIPENCAIRQWLTHEVILTLRESEPEAQPSMAAMSWRGGPLNVLYWRDEPWIRMRDMPGVLPDEKARPKKRWWMRWRDF
jgi:prophage antirepressor-like protein